MQVNIESIDFAAHMGDNGKVGYTDRWVQRRPDGSIITEPIEQDEALQIARENKATHRDSINKNTFYKQGPFETERGYVKNGQFSGWEYYRTYPPFWAGVI